MISHILLVKNMVCHRCVLAVEDILNHTSIPFSKVLFGEIYLTGEITGEQKKLLSEKLAAIGFELIDNHMSGLIEKIKKYVIKGRRRAAASERAGAGRLHQQSRGSPAHAVREVLAIHRENVLCASCHARMDPLGIRWRTSMRLDYFARWSDSNRSIRQEN